MYNKTLARISAGSELQKLWVTKTDFCTKIKKNYIKKTILILYLYL